jgi:SAM-dependent methyltransferase
MHSEEISWEEAVQTLRDDPAQRELVLACFYDDPVEQAAARYQQSTEWAALETLLPQKDGRVLDLGSGRGIVAHALSKRGWTVTAAEPDPSAIVGAEAIRRLSRTTGAPIEVVECYGEAIACESESFDLVHSRAVLHHAKDLNRLCNEVARVLRPGGKFIATREPVLTREADREIFLHNHPLHKLFGGENAYRLSIYTSAIKDAGLKIERVYNPLETDINTYPGTRAESKSRIAHRLRLPSHRWVPDLALRLLGALSNGPGRLYTFVASKGA